MSSEFLWRRPYLCSPTQTWVKTSSKTKVRPKSGNTVWGTRSSFRGSCEVSPSSSHLPASCDLLLCGSLTDQLGGVTFGTSDNTRLPPGFKSSSPVEWWRRWGGRGVTRWLEAGLFRILTQMGGRFGPRDASAHFVMLKHVRTCSGSAQTLERNVTFIRIKVLATFHLLYKDVLFIFSCSHPGGETFSLSLILARFHR